MITPLEPIFGTDDLKSAAPEVPVEMPLAFEEGSYLPDELAEETPPGEN